MTERELPQGESLKDAISEVVVSVIEQNNRLGLIVVNTISNGKITDPNELIAALLLMEKLSVTSRELIEAKGETIFSNNGAKPIDSVFEKPQEIPNEENKEPTEKDGPKSFSELLDVRIDEFLPDSDFIKKSQIKAILKNNSTVKRISQDLGFPPKKGKFTREEATLITREFLRKPSGIMRKQDKYTYQEIKSSLFIGRGAKLNEFSDEIGFHWIENPTIDFATMKDIRGLVALDKLKAKIEKLKVSQNNSDRDDVNNSGQTPFNLRDLGSTIGNSEETDGGS